MRLFLNKKNKILNLLEKAVNFVDTPLRKRITFKINLRCITKAEKTHWLLMKITLFRKWIWIVHRILIMLQFIIKVRCLRWQAQEIQYARIQKSLTLWISVRMTIYKDTCSQIPNKKICQKNKMNRFTQLKSNLKAMAQI